MIGVIFRDVGWRLLLYTATLAGIGSLAVIVVAYVVRPTFDPEFFAAGMSFDTWAYAEESPSDGVVVQQIEGLTVSPVNGRVTGGSSEADLTAHFSPSAWSFSDEDVSRFSELLGWSLTAGSVTRTGVVVDEGMMAAWGLRLGDRVSFAYVDTRLLECSATVTGMVRPYISFETWRSGLVGIPAGVCDSVVEMHVAETGGVLVKYDASGDGESKNSLMARIVVSGPLVSPVVWAILAFALLLWWVAVFRVIVQISSRTSASALALCLVGANPQWLRRRLGIVIVTTFVAGALLASVMAGALVLSITGLLIQLALQMAIVALLCVSGAVIVVVRCRRWPISERRRQQRDSE